MNIIERARAFVQHLLSLSQADRWYWQRCPHCGSTDTCRWGHYRRYPWGLQGRQALVVQGHRCHVCGRTYSEEKAEVARGSWYGREVQRLAIDMWQHGGMSLRRVGEYVRSLVGRQERWWQWSAGSRGAVGASAWWGQTGGVAVCSSAGGGDGACRHSCSHQ